MLVPQIIIFGGFVLSQIALTAGTKVSNDAHLFPYEAIQLSDGDLKKILHSKSASTSLFDFGRTSTKAAHKPRARCKTYPGDLTWPSEPIWNLFDDLLGGALIKTVPEASLCYPEWGRYSAVECEELTRSWNNSTLRIEDPTSIRSILFQGMTCMPPNYTAAFLGRSVNCSVGGFPEYTVNVTNVKQIQLGVNIARNLNIRLVIKNTGHDFGAKSTGKGAINLWTHHLKDAAFYKNYKAHGYSGPAFKFGAGVQVYEAYKLARQHNVTVIGGEGKSVGFIGGYIQGGGHSPLTSIYGMAADHVLSIQLVTAAGRFITADPKTNPDLFWALRGGGAGTFAVVTSMVVKAFPRITTTTLTYNMTSTGTFTKEKLWAAQRAYIDGFEKYADLGYYSYYRIRHLPGGELYHDMTSMVAPNTTSAQFRATMAPLWGKWEQLGVPFHPVIREFDNFPDAWELAFPHEIWTWTMRQASRFLPRDTLSDPVKRAAMVDSIKSVSDEGANILLFNMRNPPGSDQINNAVNPAWRDILGFAIMFVTWNVTDPEPYVTELSRNLTYEWNPRWRALTPGSGTYMSESDYIEPDWQESFHGDKYPRLVAIKQEWDPEDVFYATNAVGSEKWELGEEIMGHLPSQNSRLCLKEVE
ncbi:FAD binding domain-containing protein [Cercophora samala]|uniref:FAD binding domain-containing protein n=1 Tax=Cercophora samala TaxID=330535 RepID=A0AA40D2X7_9PEZI|nr:FAD binding domain-containing protein [Cercophora samala]